MCARVREGKEDGKRIGILGGTFNPIHLGHLQIAYAALKQFHLDQVLFIPAGQPPHKDIFQDVSAWQRYEMVREAISGEPAFAISDMEIRSEGKSYTYRTLRYLTRLYPRNQYYFILGEDSLESFSTWRKPQAICDCAQILAAVRQDLAEADTRKLEEEIERCRSQFGPVFYLLRTENFPVSSTRIRQELGSVHRDENLLGQWLPERVLAYIAKYQLYQREGKTMDLDEIRDALKKELTKSRYRHTEGVMYTAAALAMRYLCSMEDAMTAGLLHDCAKCLSDEEKLRICREHHLPVSEVEERHPQLLHAKVGAFLAREKYGVTSGEICHAITVHTTGCADMSFLDKIIFVSDYIEPGRNRAPRLTAVRQAAFEDIDRCCAMILQDTVEYLSVDEKSMDPTTHEAYAFYKKYL